MEALRIPTVTLSAEVLCVDGRAFPGRIFVPASAARHAGPPRAAEWLNEPTEFFPFLPNDTDNPVMFNKGEVLVISVPADTNRDELMETVDAPRPKVAVECAGRTFEGQLLIDMPSGHTRVLDYLNRPERFLTLRDGLRHHLVRKGGITRVVETSKA